MSIFGYSIPQIRKALVAAAGILASLLAANLLPDDWAHWVSTIAGVLTVLGTYYTPNTPEVPHGKHEAA